MISCLLATLYRASVHWKGLATSVDFSEEAVPILRYLAPMSRLDAFDATAPSKPRTLAVGMTNYLEHLVTRFELDHGTASASPFASCLENKADDAEPAGFQVSCANHVATILFAARVCRADCARK